MKHTDQWLVLLLIATIATVNSDPSKYEVSHLPGWNGKLPSKMYSGFTSAGSHSNHHNSEMFFHWVFVESERDPVNDPLVIWYNGGPGASSLFGLFVELGPLMLNELSLQGKSYETTGIPQLIRNEYGWSSISNLLIIDNPPPVGFSYCNPDGPTGDGTSCGSWNDTSTAQANYKFLVNWFNQFPEYKEHDLYITGESYAGIYVPTIVREILNHPGTINNLKGFAVGDGCIGNSVLCGGKGDYIGPWWHIEFFHGHGQVSNQLYNKIRKECSEESLKSGKLDQHCRKLVENMNRQIGGYYSYNLYDDCNANIFNSYEDLLTRDYWGPSYTNSVNYNPPYPPFPGPGYPCPGPAMSIWLNQTSVREALHVPTDAYFFSGDNGAGFNYTLTEEDLRPFYAHVVKNTNLRVLVYNGDTDPGINSFITQDIYFDYFEQKNIAVKEDWRPWTLNGKTAIGGYVKEYIGDFAYLTIRGSGHMVPEFKPNYALGFLKVFLEGKDYPKYNK
eukprot:TRINITY_DN8380_c0_g1_i1.p1 TRINITY_DN8380_c0_g1~~TRINITY_DN8380_c0_g1_i1.p1  ORF type:complete len:503 (+),score=91.19 TRINITY_DN8380_c0_g1_i1:204-1712(+)